MRKDYQNPPGKPPVWAEAFLRAVLAQRSRDAIAGDLLEEYRESVLPAVGVFRARIWYVRQVFSFFDALSCDTVSFCHHDEVRAGDIDEGIAFVVEELLPLAYHTQEPVIQDEDLYIDLTLHDRS